MAENGARAGNQGPDFFIVGAAKGGTTAMHAYLSEHPEVFMCKRQMHMFGSDLRFGPAKRLPTWDEYLAAFARAGDAKRLGDSSAGYLYSTRAAREIKEYRPDARIIVMLRNPVEVVPALHASHIYVGDDDLVDIEEALAAEDDRREGRRIPVTNELAWALCYRDVVRFRDQLERYLETFGPDQVHVIVYDDFREDTALAFRRTLQFLDVDPDFEPKFEIVNAHHRARIRALGTVSSKPSAASSGPWMMMRRVARLMVPSRDARLWLYRRIMRANTVYERRQPLPTKLRQQLEVELADDVRGLGALLGRDLSHWVDGRGMTSAEAPVASHAASEYTP
jgi:hypothetical protein